MVPREGYYAAMLGEVLAWWRAPDLEITFFRPLSAATHLLDNLLWPELVPLHHLHSVLWYGLAIAALTWMCRQVSASVVTATFMALLFAIEDSHGMPAGWIANRNSLVTLFFGSLAIGLHVRWRRGDGAWNGLASWGSLALGLAGGESALGAVAYIVAWEACFKQGTLLRRALALAPTLLVVVGWRLLYNGLGFRTWNSGLYIDPGREPLAFLQAAVERAPLLLLSQWTQAQVDLFIAFPRPLQVLSSFLAGVCALALLALFRRALLQDAEARFWALGMALAVVPVCATFPMDRLLTFTGIGAFGLLGVQVRRLGWLDGVVELEAGRLLRWGTGALVVLHLLIAPPLLALRSYSPSMLYAAAEDGASFVPSEAPAQDEVWVVVNGFDLFAMYMPILRAEKDQTVPGSLEILGCVLAAQEITRSDERTLVLRPEGGFLKYSIEHLTRSPSLPFQVGQKIQRARMEVEILEVLPDGRPSAVQFRFDTSLEDRSIRWFQADGFSSVAWTPPPVGESGHLPGLALWGS